MSTFALPTRAHRHGIGWDDSTTLLLDEIRTPAAIGEGDTEVSLDVTIDPSATQMALAVPEVRDDPTQPFTRVGLARVPGGLEGGSNLTWSFNFEVPEGGQYRVRNENDPNGNNSIDHVSERPMQPR